MVQIFDGLYQLLKDDGWLILLEKCELFSVLEQIPFSQQLSHYVNSSFRVEIAEVANNVGVMAEFQNAFFEFDHFFLVLRKLELLYDLHSNFFVGFLLDPTVDWWEIACSYFFQNLILVIDTVLFELLKISEPLFLHLLVLEIVFLLRVDPIPMLDDYAKTIFVFLLFHDQPLHILHLDGGLAFLFAEH